MQRIQGARGRDVGVEEQSELVGNFYQSLTDRVHSHQFYEGLGDFVLLSYRLNINDVAVWKFEVRVWIISVNVDNKLKQFISLHTE